MFIIPASTAPNSYDVRCDKDGKESNPVAVAVIPDVKITSMSCSSKQLLTITGSNFSAYMKGADDHLGVEIDGVPVTIRSWDDNQIQALVPNCTTRFTTDVNALFGSESGLCSKGCIKRRIRRR
jgi:hypothetical protein